MADAELKRYFIINKPYNMVSQFVSSHVVPLLGEIDFDFPKDTHAIGRLDLQSEGLLILTTDKTVTRKIFLSAKPHHRSYLVMVQRKITDRALQQMREGIPIKIKAAEVYLAKAEAVEIVTDPLKLYPFATDPREAYPHSWLLITLTEGKYRQVRKMVFAAGHRCLRLIRVSIGDLELGDLAPGVVKEITEKKFYSLIDKK